MRVEFDLNDYMKTPLLTLMNPNKTVIDIISQHRNLVVTPRFNDVSDLTFEVYDIEDVSYFNKLIPNRILELEGYGRFLIMEVNEDHYGDMKSKQILAQSLEIEFGRRSIFINGTYKFFDITNPYSLDTIVGKIFSYIREWKINSVDAKLYDIYRTFDIQDKTLYGFVREDCYEVFDAIFIFDTINMKVDIKHKSSLNHKVDVFLTHKNLINQSTKKSSLDNIYTCLSVFGGNDLSIGMVNCLGGSRIYNFDYYMNYTDDDGNGVMSSVLVEKIKSWKVKIEESQESYARLLMQYKIENGDLIKLESGLKDLESQLTSLLELQKVKLDQGLDCEDVYIQIKNKETEIEAKKVEVTSKKSDIQTTKDGVDAIVNSLSFEKNFTETELNELDRFIIESVHIDENFIIGDNMDEVKKTEIAQLLYDRGVEILSELASPTYEFTFDMLNMIALPEYQDTFTKSIKLGSIVTVKIDDKLYEVTLLELPIAFEVDQVTNCKAVFSTSVKASSEENRFKDSIKKAIGNGSKTSMNSQQWSQYNKDKGDISQAITGVFDASIRNIKNAENEEIVMGSFGIIGKQALDDGTYSPQQLWLTSKNIVMSEDEFRTASVAIGELEFKGVKHYGVASNLLIGRSIIGEQFEFQHYDGKFTFDSNGATLTNATLTITNERNNILINSDDGIKIQKNNNGTLIDTFYVDVDGNLCLSGTLNACNIIGGSIEGSALNIGNGRFTVDEMGYCIATDVELTNPKMNDGTLRGGSIDIGDGAFTVDSGGNAKLSTLTGTIVSSATFKGGIYETWSDGEYGGQMDSMGLHVYQGEQQIGSLSYTNENPNGNLDAMLICSTNGYALKLSSDGDMSIEPNHEENYVWIKNPKFYGDTSAVKARFG